MNVANSGWIEVTGISSIGILAQSIGGGGGVVYGTEETTIVIGDGDSGGSGGDVNVTNTGFITTHQDNSTAIIAHSIGGGGGHGSGGGSFSAGGAGGSGGNGGTVTVTHSLGTITVDELSSQGIPTDGDNSHGILAQSIGGGGGNGGSDKALFVATGGSGGNGGDGGQVSVAVGEASIIVNGDYGYGILAQSIGGGGGSGGAGDSDAKNQSQASAIDIEINVGGTGGKASSGGAVTMENQKGGVISTQGSGAHGLMAQSIGGGGGQGGLGDDSGTADNSLSVAIGANGGASGNGGTVAVTTNGTLTTQGIGATALLAQSIGGSGGQGGQSKALVGGNAGKDQSIGIAFSLGGKGTSGGNGGTVTVNVDDVISTSGNHANGVLAQSIGGGGGSGGAGDSDASNKSKARSISLSLALGGSGSGGGTGGDVVVDLASTISTTGSGARGILAQSIGGGGYSGGGTAASDGETFSVDVALGGSLSGTSDGGDVTVTSQAGNIITLGGSADGILAQSIGGGGGTGGSADASASGTSSGTSVSTQYDFSLALGGSNSMKGDGGTVAVNFTAETGLSSISTAGIRANGIFAQSVGGGGGVGGVAKGDDEDGTVATRLTLGGNSYTLGDGGSVTVTTQVVAQGLEPLAGGAVSISTAGAQSHAILAQSVGGAGGYGADGSADMTTTMLLGGNLYPSGGGTGGPVSVNIFDETTLATLGDDAYGVFAQSVGGGGGIANTGDGSGQGSGALKATLAGSALDAGNGGAVAVTQNPNQHTSGTANIGTISTSGNRAFGIFAQSVGGGGGTAATADSAALGSLSLGGSEYDDDGGDVTVRLNGSQRESQSGTVTTGIVTTGAGSYGVFAQSVGGGGGFAGDAAATNFTLSETGGVAGLNGGYGNGGDVAVTQGAYHTIATTGTGAHGIFAQSVGGGGGVIGGGKGGTVSAIGTGGGLGNGGAVSVTTAGIISATGLDAYGIFAQSAGASSGTNGALTVNVLGTIIGGTGNGAGIFLSGGSPIAGGLSGNTITISDDATVSAGSGLAIATSATTRVEVTNNGTVVGNLDLGMDSIFLNGAGGTLMSGAAINVSTFRNQGVIDIGGIGVIQKVNFNGTLMLEDGGALLADFDYYNNQSDQITAMTIASTGDTKLQMHNLSLVPHKTLDLVANAGEQDGKLILPTDLVYTYGMSGFGQNIGVTRADFTPEAVDLTLAGRATADVLQLAWNNYGLLSNGMERYFSNWFGRLSGLTAAEYAQAVDRFGLGAAFVPLSDSVAEASAFTSRLMSCPAFQGSGTLLQEEECNWARVIGSRSSYSGEDEFSGSDGTGLTLAMGSQRQIAENWFLGGSVAYDMNWDGDSNESVNSSEVSAGLVLKHQMGPWLLSAAISGGYGWRDMDRSLGLLDVGTAHATSNSGYVQGRLRAAYEWTGENWYIQPSVDLDITHAWRGGFTETGAGVFNWVVDSASKTFLAVTPNLEFGARLNIADDIVLRPYMGAGVMILSDDSWQISQRLQGMPDVTEAQLEVPMSTPIGRFSLGMDVLSGSTYELKVEVGVEAAEDYLGQSGSIRFGYYF